MVAREEGEHDAHGCLANYNRAAQAFNKKLSDLCDEVRLRRKDATVVYTDMFAIKYGFVANHTKYGMNSCNLNITFKLQRSKFKTFAEFRTAIDNNSSSFCCTSGIEWPLMVCCGNGGPPYNFNPGKYGCGDLCGPEAKVLSWDGVHFTDFGSGLAAKHAMSGEYSKPRVKLASLINGASKKPSSVS
jgi:hypothetical protein